VYQSILHNNDNIILIIIIWHKPWRWAALVCWNTGTPERSHFVFEPDFRRRPSQNAVELPQDKQKTIIKLLIIKTRFGNYIRIIMINISKLLAAGTSQRYNYSFQTEIWTSLRWSSKYVNTSQSVISVFSWYSLQLQALLSYDVLSLNIVKSRISLSSTPLTTAVTVKISPKTSQYILIWRNEEWNQINWITMTN